jgi:hypothetical protein
MSLIKHEQRYGFAAPSVMTCGMRLAMASLACCLVLASARAQQQPPQNLDPAAPPAQVEPPAANVPAANVPAANAPPPSSRPGFIDALGRFLGDSKEALESQVRGTQEALGTIGSTARDAAGNVIAIPGTRVITGRQLCPAASNGAPDCQQGADALCRAKGFQGGRNLDVTSAQRCPARVYLENRPPKDGECRTETFVTRAVCQ